MIVKLNGREYRVESGLVDTYYGPEMEVKVYTMDGDLLARRVEPASVEQILFWIEEDLDDYLDDLADCKAEQAYLAEHDYDAEARYNGPGWGFSDDNR